MERRVCFPFCQGHYGGMQSHRQEIQFEMSYNLQSTINHPLLKPRSLPFPHIHTHTLSSCYQCTASHVGGHVHAHTNTTATQTSTLHTIRHYAHQVQVRKDWRLHLPKLYSHCWNLHYSVWLTHLPVTVCTPFKTQERKSISGKPLRDWSVIRVDNTTACPLIWSAYWTACWKSWQTQLSFKKGAWSSHSLPLSRIPAVKRVFCGSSL